MDGTPSASDNNKSWLQTGIHAATSLFLGNDKTAADKTDTSTRSELEQCAGELLKTIPLFIPKASKAVTIGSYVASGLFYGLDQVQTGGDTKTQAADFALGALKGSLTKWSFDLIGRSNLSGLSRRVETASTGLRSLSLPMVARPLEALKGTPIELAVRAWGLGISSRLIDTGLTRQTYTDDSGKFDPVDGLGRTLKTTFNPTMLAADVGMFAASPFLVKGLNKIALGTIEKSLFAQTVTTAGTFGMMSGSLGELQRQRVSKEDIDPWEIARRGLIDGATTALGAAPGGRMMKPSMMAHPPLSAQPRNVEPRESLPPSMQFAAATTLGNEVKYLPDRMKTALPEKAGAQNFDPTADKLAVANHIEVSREPDPLGGAPGARAYETIGGSPAKFFQLPDGRIYYEQSNPIDESRPFQRIWSPHTSETPNSFVDINDSRLGRKILTRDDGEGIFYSTDGTKSTNVVRNDYEPADRLTIELLFRDEAKRLSQLPQAEQLATLALPTPPAEEDWHAGQRLLTLADGANYKSDVHSYRLRQLVNGKMVELPPEGSSIKATDTITFGARRYFVLSHEQAADADDLHRALAKMQVNQSVFDAKLSELQNQATQVLVPEDYAQTLDALRTLRSKATLSPTAHPEHAEDILLARRQLFLSPYRDRILPEHLGQYLDSLPNRGLINEIHMLPETADAYGAEVNTSADAVGVLGRIRMFERGTGVTVNLQNHLRHEWSHLSESGARELYVAHLEASKLESFFGRGYAFTNGEQWSVHMGEMFLNPNPEIFATLAIQSPIRAVLEARALKLEMADAAPENVSTVKSALERRIAFVENNVLPMAQESVNKILSGDDPGEILILDQMLQHLSADKRSSDLRLSLLDTETLKKEIDSIRTKSTRWQDRKPSNDMRTVLLMGILKKMDPAAFAERSHMDEQAANALRQRYEAYLLNPKYTRFADRATGLGRHLIERPDLLDRLIGTDTLRKAVDSRNRGVSAGAILLLGSLRPTAHFPAEALLDTLPSAITATADPPELQTTRTSGAFSSEEVHMMEEQNDPKQNAFGARKYVTSIGRRFIQFPDGRILYDASDEPNRHAPLAERTAGAPREQRIWAPFGSEQKTARLVPPPPAKEIVTELPKNRPGLLTYTLDDRHGIYFSRQGQPKKPLVQNWFDQPHMLPDYVKLQDGHLDSMTMVDGRLEPDWMAEQRLLPNEFGEPYSQDVLTIDKLRPGLKPETLDEKEFVANLVPTTVPSRTYHLLSHQQMIELSDMRERLSPQHYEENVARMRKETVPVKLPEEYAAKLDVVRDLRRVAVLNPQTFTDISESILEARRQLFLSPYRDTLLPEHFGQFFDTLPNARKVNELVLLDESSAQYNHNPALADASLMSRRMRIYAGSAQANMWVRRLLKHEWTHLTEGSHLDLRTAHDAAVDLEHFRGNDYASESAHEQWAVHFGEMFLDSNPELFLTLAGRTPLRTVILSRALESELSDAPELRASIDENALRHRLEYVNNTVMPAARAGVLSALSSEEPSTVIQAANVLNILRNSTNNYDLPESLLDGPALQNLIDAPLNPKVQLQPMSSTLVSAVLLDQLRRVAPQQFAARREVYDRSVNFLRTQYKDALKEDGTLSQLQALNFAKLIGKTTMESRAYDEPTLFSAIFDRSSLEQVVLKSKVDVAADQALETLMDVYHDTPENRKLMEQLPAASRFAPKAAAFLARQSDAQAVLQLKRLIDNGLNVDRDLRQALISRINAQLLGRAATSPYSAYPMLLRAELVRSLIDSGRMQGSDAVDTDLRQVEHLRNSLRAHIATSETLTIDGQAYLPLLLDLLAGGNPTALSLGRDLAAETTLRPIILNGGGQAQTAFELMIRLHEGTDTFDLFIRRLANSQLPFAEQARQYLQHRQQS